MGNIFYIYEEVKMDETKQQDYRETISHCIDNLSNFYQELLIKKQIEKEKENRRRIRENNIQTDQQA